MKKLIFAVGVLLLAGNGFAFNDVQTTHKNKQAIEYLKQNDVIGGYSDGTFKPNNKINRAELLKILVGGRGVTPSVDDYNNCFPDVKTEWFAPYVCYAKAQEWVNGYPDGTFQPAKTVLKVEALKMTLNAYGIQTVATTEKPFEDIEAGAWYVPFVAIAKEKGLLEETGVSFMPSGEITRGSASENIFRTVVMKKSKADHFSQELVNEIVNIVKENVTKDLVEYIDEKIENAEGEPSQSPPPTQECPIVNGTGLKTWDGSAWGQCEIVACSQHYSVKDNLCQPETESCSVENGMGIRTWDVSNSHWGICQPDIKIESCSVENGIGKRTWDVSNSRWGECQPDTNMQSCSVENGIGKRTWDVSNSRWEECQLDTCNSGYKKQESVCVPICGDSQYLNNGICVSLNCSSEVSIKRTDGQTDGESIVVGTKDRTFLEFTLENNNCSEVKISSITLSAKGTGSALPYSNFPTAIYVDGTQQGSTEIFAADGLISFGNFSITLPPNEKKEFSVVVDTLKQSSSGTLKMSLVEVGLTNVVGGTVLVNHYSNGVPFAQDNPLKGAEFILIPSGTLTVSLDSTTASDFLIAGQSNVEVLRIRFSADDDEVQIKDLYLNNDIGNDGVVTAGTDTDIGNRVDFKLYNGAGQLISQETMWNGTLHFELANTDRIRVPKDDSTFVMIKADVRDISQANQTGKRMKLSLNTVNTGTYTQKGIEAVTASTGDDITTPSSGWGDAVGQDFVVYNTALTIAPAATQPSMNLPSTASTEMYRFTVTADSADNAEIGRVSMDVALNGLGASGVSLFTTQKFVSGTPDPNQAFTTLPSVAVADNDTTVRLFVNLAGERLAAGESQTYAVFMSLTDEMGTTAENSDGVTVTLKQDTSYSPPTNKSGQSSAFILWSDESDPSHTDTTLDWMNGYLLDIDTNGKRLTK